MSEKNNLDPTLRKQHADGNNANTRAMKKRRGRPKKSESMEPSKATRDVPKLIRFTEEEYAKVLDFMIENHISNFSEYGRLACLQLRPIIIMTEDFTELRKARRDIVNYINIVSSRELSDAQRKELLLRLEVQEEWGNTLKNEVRQVDNLIEKIHNKVVLADKDNPFRFDTAKKDEKVEQMDDLLPIINDKLVKSEILVKESPESAKEFISCLDGFIESCEQRKKGGKK